MRDRIGFALEPAAVLFAVLAVLASITPAAAWGSVGHEVVATIAQTQLHPNVRAKLCDILPTEHTSYRSTYPNSKDGKVHRHCHLAPFASWPDVIKRHIPWSSHLHYVNPNNDTPPAHCTFGETGWADHGTGNVLDAIVNYTTRVAHDTGRDRDYALRFLTHYIGDLHQPLHLTGRARGGNDIPVRFEGRYARLHTVWDSLMLNAQIRSLENYTSPLQSPRIESALRGKTYDAYIRWILVEGLGQGKRIHGHPLDNWWWQDESEEWLACPNGKMLKAPSKRRAHWLQAIVPHSSRVWRNTYSTISGKSRATKEADQSKVDRTDTPVCPYAWSKPMHPLVCKYAFAEPVPGPGDNVLRNPLAELDVPEYFGRIRDEHVLEKQLAKAGVRLAAVLNSLLLTPHDLDDYAHISQSSKIAEDEPKKKHGKHGGHHKDPSQRSPIWSLIIVTTESIAEVIILSSVGYVLARQGILDKTTQTKINKVNISFFTPSLLFSKVAFTLDPGRLAELLIVPAGFVIITSTSAIVAWLLARVARITRAQRNFSIACAITPNSNSLPVALMQSLVATVPQLHWEEEGEPEDTTNGMLGRALTYLVLFSTLGMFLRWSLGAKLLSSLDEGKEEGDPVTGLPRDSQRERNRRAREVQESEEHAERRNSGQRSASRGRQAPQAWVRSFPNAPEDYASENEEDDEDTPLLRRDAHGTDSQRSRPLAYAVQTYEVVMKPLRAIARFMTIPLYAALLSLFVAMVPPLQRIIAGIEPLVGAMETAGACSIPLTMVVLGAYFYEEPQKRQEAESRQVSPAATRTPSSVHSVEETLVDRGNGTILKKIAKYRNDQQDQQDLFNDSRDTSATVVVGQGESTDTQASRSHDIEQREANDTTQAVSEMQERRAKRKATLERRTIIVAIASRMLITPLLLLPAVAWYAIATRYNVMDDPVFITCACLLIGSPPALTLAQITSQSAKGGDGGFERLISKTIFVSYAILATPTTIVLVLTALLVAENDH